MKNNYAGCLLTRYFYIKSMTTDMRYLALKQWEEDAKHKIEQQ